MVVSHDRYFLEKICNKLLVFEEGRSRKLEMNDQEYMNKMEAKSRVDDQMAEDGLQVENLLTEVVSRLSLESPSTRAYLDLDRTYQQLIRKKRELS